MRPVIPPPIFMIVIVLWVMTNIFLYALGEQHGRDARRCPQVEARIGSAATLYVCSTASPVTSSSSTAWSAPVGACGPDGRAAQ